jgi:hypothetical protein
MRSDLGALVVDECFCQLRSEDKPRFRCSTAPNATQRNLELVFGSDSRFTEESRGTKYFYIQVHCSIHKFNLIKV